MAEYDGSIRIETGIDTEGFDKDGKRLESKAKNLGKSISNSVDENIKVDAENVKKEVEEVFDDLEKEEKRIEELAKRAVERAHRQQEEISAPQTIEESRPFTPGYNKEAMEALSAQTAELEKTDEQFNLLKIDVEEYSKALKELKSQGKFFGDEEFDKVYLAWKNATDAVKAYQAELNKQTASGQEKAAAQAAKEAERQEAAQRRIEEQAEKALQKENARIQKEIENQAKLEAKEAERRAKREAEIVEEERLDQIRVKAVASNDKIIAKVERIKQLEQEIADLKAAGVTEGYADYDDRIRELSEHKRDVVEYGKSLSKVPEQFDKMQKSAKKAFNAVSDGANKSNKSLSGGFKTILKYGFGIRSLYALFNKIRSGIKEGFSNFMNYSSDFANTVQGMKNAMSTLGNQFAAAFSPIVQLIIPWLTKLINAISTAMTYVAQFIAILGGKSTFTRAKQVQDGYNKSLGGTAAAAKKAYGALAKFDDLDVLQKKDEDETGGGMGDAVGDMFEEVPVDSKFKDWLDGILKKLKPILDYLKKLKDIFMEGFWDGLGDWEYRLEIIKDAIASIKESLIDIFTDPAVVSAADRWAQSVAYMLGSLAGSIASIGLTIAANLFGGISKYLEQNKDRIKKFLVDAFDIRSEINYLLADFFQSFAYVFEAFASENGQQLTANIIGIFVDAFMGVELLADKFTRDILNIFTQPFVDNKEEFRAALEGFLGVLAEVTGTIKQGIDDTFDKLNEVYDAHFKPFFDSVAQGLSDLLSHFLEFWNGNVQPILDEWAALFDELWTVHIQPMIDNFIELLGGLADMLKALWENVLKPLVDWVIDNILPPVLTIIDGIVTAFMGFIGFLADIVSSIIDIIKGIVQFLTDVFKGDWEAAWNDIVELFDGSIFEKIKEAGAHFINGLIEGIKEKWENLKESVKETGSKMLDTLRNVLSTHSPSKKTEEIGGYTIEGFIIGLESKSGYVSNIWTKIKEDTISILQSMADWISNFGFNISDSLTSALQGIQEYFTETWTSIYESTIETWTLIQEYFIEYWTLFIESLTETWEEILLLFTEKWEEIQLLFEEFILFLNEIFLVSWLETWTLAGDQYQTFHDLLTALTKAIQEMLTLFMKKIEELINTMWKKSWKNAENIFVEFKGKVQEICDAVREIVQELFDFVMDLVSQMLAAIESVGSAAASISGSGGFSGGGATPAMASYSAQSFAAYTADLPHLASGTVLRGGNPFAAVINDQPRGHVNVEAPLNTIKQAVREELSGMNYGSSVNPIISLNVNGEEFARLTLGDILNEMGRQGYDVDVLGVV